jgi:hypothetical protein
VGVRIEKLRSAFFISFSSIVAAANVSVNLNGTFEASVTGVPSSVENCAARVGPSH